MAAAPEYVFADGDAEQERQRLLAVQEEFDPDTFHWLDQLAIQPGWSCLEIGYGAGSVLRELAQRVGVDGEVTGLDLDARFVGEISESNVTVYEGDVAECYLGEGIYDLAHARFVLIHVRQREAALANILQALKPGGWLLLEEPDFTFAGPTRPHGTAGEILTRVYEATRQMYLSVGGAPFLGRQLPGWLQSHGLTIEGAEASAALWQGGSARGQRRWQAVEQLWPRLLATELTTEEDLRYFLELVHDPTIWAFDYTTVAAWCRKPAVADA